MSRRQPAAPEDFSALYPDEYRTPWREPFHERVRAALRPGVRILDVGPGRSPTVPPAERPPGTMYVALERSREEVEAAAERSYDRVVVADAAAWQPELADSFDLVVSWQVLEHVKPLPRALAAIRGYLVPGGRLVAFLSGAFAAYAVANRLIPHALAVQVNRRLLGREPESMFPAHYDRCWYSALAQALEPWSAVEIVPLYRGASYFDFSPLLLRAYVAYERWAKERGHRNLATHYLVDAVR